jgi:hypothetical protein
VDTPTLLALVSAVTKAIPDAEPAEAALLRAWIDEHVPPLEELHAELARRVIAEQRAKAH